MMQVRTWDSRVVQTHPREPGRRAFTRSPVLDGVRAGLGRRGEVLFKGVDVARALRAIFSLHEVEEVDVLKRDSQHKPHISHKVAGDIPHR